MSFGFFSTMNLQVGSNIHPLRGATGAQSWLAVLAGLEDLLEMHNTEDVTWNCKFGIQNMEFGIHNPEFRIRNLEF